MTTDRRLDEPRAPVHRFVVPPLSGPPTGGTRYNAELVAALRRRGASVIVAETYEGSDDLTWVDSLFLPQFSAWAQRGPLGLLTHYLPTLVRVGARPPREALTEVERSALRCAHGFVVPSPWLAAELVALDVPTARIGVVEPGVRASARPAPGRNGGPLTAVLVANLTPGKGVAPLLEALATRSTTGFVLRIVGSPEMDPAYADRCRSAAAPLGRAVVFEGSQPAETCLQRVRGADLLLSASRMESYGMAIADARACGVPVLARRGGNVDNLVSATAGGVLVEDVVELAEAFVALAADRRALERRLAAARAHAPARSWDTAADAFVSAAARLR
ncbi:MAG: glycosyltransferase family 4 protein [Myxococcota bacterium]